MMKRKLIGCAVALSVMAGMAAPAAHAEIGASVGAGNMYYWRGYDLGGGAQVWGDINYSESGFYAGMWASSGDGTLGQEYDLYFGYGNEISGFSYDLSYWTYSYPSDPTAVAGDEPAPGDLAEVILGLGYGGFAFTYYEGVSDLEDYDYMTFSYGYEAFSILYGEHEGDYAHVDLGYSYNDNLSFTLGLVADDVDGTANDEAKFVVSFSIPIEM